MKNTAVIMGMPVTVYIAGAAKEKDIANIFSYLQTIDEIFSTYKSSSEISRINSGALEVGNSSKEVQHVLSLCEGTKKITNGYFDMQKNGKIDPSGIVKGYAIHEAAKRLRKKGYTNFFIEIAGDVETAGKNDTGEAWRVGIENPFNRKEIIKIIHLINKGIATSGNYIQGTHIYDPVNKKDADEIASITVIADNVYEADRFATAAFAMGEKGISFIENTKGLEGYMITKDKTAIYTRGFDAYALQ